MTGPANDYSVCFTSVMIKSDYYLMDVFRARLQYPDLRRKVASLAGRYGAETILIEDAGPGMQLLQDLRRDTPAAESSRRPQAWRQQSRSHGGAINQDRSRTRSPTAECGLA